MSTAGSALAATVPTELGGAIQSNRSSFQKNWTITLILDLHAKPDDYVVICDYHDDVVVVLGEKLHFTQVKSKRPGSWTMNMLTKHKVGSLSILGKLYAHERYFPTLVGSLSFVSNAPFDLTRADGVNSKTLMEMCFDDLEAAASKSACESVASEHKLTQVTFPKETHFLVCSLPVDSDDATIGIIAKFVKNNADGGLDMRAAALHKTLFGEIRRRVDDEAVHTTVAGLAKHKGLSRGQVDSMLRVSRAAFDVRAAWDAWIASSLTQSGFPIQQVIKIGAAWNRYYGQRTDATNETLQELRDRVVEAFIAVRNEPDTRKMLDQIVTTVGEDESYGPDYIIAIALMEQVASDHPKLKAADSKPADKAK